MKTEIDLKTLSTYLLVALILCEVCTASAKPAKDAQMNKQPKDTHNTDRRHRHRRQAADFILMGYKAKGALGTTRPSDFYRRIGKKRADSPFSGLSKPYLQPDIQAVAVDRTGFLLDNDDNPQRW